MHLQTIEVQFDWALVKNLTPGARPEAVMRFELDVHDPNAVAHVVRLLRSVAADLEAESKR